MSQSYKDTIIEVWHLLSRTYLYMNAKIKIHLRSKYAYNLRDTYSQLTIIENTLPNMQIHPLKSMTYAHSILDRTNKQIFPLEENLLSTPGQLFLAIGQIGTGKTWLARHISTLWANDLINEGKNILIYIDCELPEVKSAKDIQTCISSLRTKGTNFVDYFEHLFVKDGQNLIFIIDAYDVLLRYVPNSPLHELVRRKILSKSSILILSRPCVHFYNEMNTTYLNYTKLEVLGFSSKICNEYFTKSSIKLLEGSQAVFVFLNIFPDLRQFARFPLIAFSIIKLVSIENLEQFVSVDYIMKHICVIIINQQLSHYLTGDIKSQYLNIVSLNSVSRSKFHSLGHLYKTAYQGLLDSFNTVQQDIPTFHEGFAPDGMGIYCTNFIQVNSEWKPRYTFINLITQEFLAALYTKGNLKSGQEESYEKTLPILQKKTIPHFMILGCSKELLLNEEGKDIFHFYLPQLNNSLTIYALLLNIIIECGFVHYQKISATLLFPSNTIELLDYPMEGWILRGVSYFLNKISNFTSLTFSNCSITDQILYFLITNMNINSNITFVNLQGNKLTDSSIPIIRNSFRHILSSLRKLDLSNNSIDASQVISLESDFPQIEFISHQTIPQEILSRGEEFVYQYQLACNEGSQQIKFFRLMVVGSEGVGKTSLLKALRNQPFEGKEVSTDFIEKTDITITELSNDWSQNLSFKERLKETRDDILAHITVKRVKSLTNLSNLADNTNLSELILQPESNTDLDTGQIDENTNLNFTKSEPDLVLENDKIPEETKLESPTIESQPEEIDTPTVEIEPEIPEIKIDTNDPNEEISKIDPPFVSSSMHLSNLPLKNIQEHWSNQRTILPIEFFTVWDLAGQSYFFCMHSLFLTPRAVYLMPVDLSVNLKEPVLQRKRETGRLDRREIKGKVTHLDIIQYWIMTIYSVAKSTSTEVYECKSRIIIVFTKADLADDPVEKAAADYKLITDSLSRKCNCLSIVDKNYHIVSAKDRSLEGFTALKESIHTNADQIGFNHALPVRWLDFALNILSSSNPVLGKADITKISEQTNCAGDYTEILQLFHSIGVFFFRKNILVKSLQNLLDIIFHVVSPMNCLNLIPSLPKISKSKCKQENFRQEIENAYTTAVLTDNILYAILQRNNLTEVKTEITQLLEEFGVLLFKSGHGKHREHYIPYLFKEDITAIYQAESTDQTIYLYFPDNQVPTSFYFALLSLCLDRCNASKHKKFCKNEDKFSSDCRKPQWQMNLKIDKHDPKLAFDCVKFQWESNLTCILDFTEHQPYIRVIFQDIDYSDLAVHSRMFSLLFTIQKWIIQIQRELILSGKLAKIVLNCPCNSFARTLRPCVYFETFLKQSGHESHFYCKLIPSVLGLSFIDKYHGHIVQNLDLEFILEALFEEGLINGEELAQIFSLEKKEKVEMILRNLPNKGKEWAHKFYKVLKSKSVENREIRSLYESYIVEKLYAEVPKGEDLDFSRYPILNNPCGICLIIHIENFDDNSKRRGSHLDFLNLKQTFENMNFLIHSYEDSTKIEMRKILTELRCMDHSAFDTFFCIVMSHGDEDECIVTRDMKTIKKDTILNHFTADSCPSLAGKPKVFIFQACRGQKQDHGIEMISAKEPVTTGDEKLTIQTDDFANIPGKIEHIESDRSIPSSSQEVPKKVANFADFYIAQATVKGYVSYRYVTRGSVFISAFCSVLKSARYHHHLVDMMIEVRRQVSMVDVNSNVQCPEATDTFTKQLYLF
ncbi:Caspase-3-like [Oopsacas minuta]|uniref:Caspase-3-like n=1 Tax=Oopsacas minuta TaxID=111878 RepID=A0AAV7JUM9_9METZ|nr:Caspase-3-like [Oopsacas minuta]